MVGWYFMHLKFEGRWVYYMLVPAGILAAVFIFALMPDIAMGPSTEENNGGVDDANASVFAALDPGRV